MRVLRGVAFVVLGALAIAGASTAPVLVAVNQPPLSTPALTCRVKDGDGHLVRSRARVCLFLRMAGYIQPSETCRVPAGMRVDHTIPLACGGADVPSNMSLLTEEEWRQKTAWERRPCSAWWDGTNTRSLQRGRYPNLTRHRGASQ